MIPSLFSFCPYCNHSLEAKKDRKHFKVHICTNPKCSYYLHNHKKLPKHTTNFKFKKFNPHVLGLMLTYHVNLKLSTRQTAHALKEFELRDKPFELVQVIELANQDAS